ANFTIQIPVIGQMVIDACVIKAEINRVGDHGSEPRSVQPVNARSTGIITRRQQRKLGGDGGAETQPARVAGGGPARPARLRILEIVRFDVSRRIAEAKNTLAHGIGGDVASDRCGLWESAAVVVRKEECLALDDGATGREPEAIVL